MTNPDDDVVVVGDPLPRLASVTPLDGFQVAVTWDGGQRQVVDLASAIMRYKVYAPLRDDPALFRTLHVQEHGFGIAWGVESAIDMSATTVEELAAEAMSAEDLAAFMKRHGFTLDSLAAELGLSRRMVAYYKTGQAVPRTVALACRYIDGKMSSERLRSDVVQPGQFGSIVAREAIAGSTEDLARRMATPTETIKGLGKEASWDLKVSQRGFVEVLESGKPVRQP